MTEPVLQIKDLCVDFLDRGKSITAVDHLSLDIFPGETVGLVGESGCGKSTTSLAVMQLLDPHNSRISHGSIKLAGKELLSLKESELEKVRGDAMSMIFQEPMTSLNPVYTLGKQLTEGIILHQGISQKEAEAKAIDMMKKVEIPRPEQMLKSYPFELSGGMRQRIMIAMALSCNPKLLIADEPTTALDVTVQAQILDLMNALKDELDMAIILITHDLGVVAEMCKYVYVMYAGQIVETAAIDDLLDHPLHPYTQGLLNSMPERWLGGERLYSIPGTVPPPGTKITGCKFADRCQYCTQLCRMASPPLRRLDEHRSVRCLYCNGEGVQGGAVS
ncbi:ABC transporter ATP-binding protein [Acidaminococcus massiliensis]|nr:ABC transporter ATP-binding protein [Acidaminococcus massiliensis]